MGGLVPGVIDAADDGFPLRGIDIPLHGHDVPNLQAVTLGDVNTDDARVALAFKPLELLPLDHEFGIDIEKSIRIHRQTGEELIFVNIDAGKPDRIGHFVDAANLRDAIAVTEP